MQPISFWYYTLNRRERAKRRYRKLYEHNKRMASVMQIYNRDLIADFTGLSGKALDSCIIYCNANIQLEPDDSKFIVNHKLLEVLSEYAGMKKAQ